MTIDFDDLFDFEDTFPECESNPLYQQQHYSRHIIPEGKFAQSEHAKRENCLPGTGTPLLKMPVPPSHPTHTSGHSEAMGDGSKYSISHSSHQLVFPENDRVSMAAYDGVTNDELAFHKSYSHADPSADRHQQLKNYGGVDAFSSAATGQSVFGTSSFLENQRRESARSTAGDQNQQMVMANSNTIRNNFIDENNEYSGSRTFVPESSPLHSGESQLYMTSHLGGQFIGNAPYLHDGNGPVVNATEFQLSEDIKNASATLSVLQQHSHSNTTPNLQMSHASMGIPAHGSHPGQMMTHQTHFYQQAIPISYTATPSINNHYSISQSGIPVEQLVAQGQSFHQLIPNAVVLSPIPGHQVSQTGNIPISGNAYGLPSPHSLIAVAHSPVAVSGSPLSNSYGNGNINSALNMSNAISNSNQTRKNLDDGCVVPYVGSDKLHLKRERNRLAAERCRKRKLERIETLQVENELLQKEDAQLQAENKLLKKDVDQLQAENKLLKKEIDRLQAELIHFQQMKSEM